MNVTYIERTPGTWRLRIETTNPTGGRAFAYETVHGAEDAARKRRFEILQQYEQGTWAAPDKILFGAFLDRWQEQRLALGTIGRSTKEGQCAQLDRYVKPALGGVRLQAVTGAQLQSLYTDLLTKPTKLRAKLEPSVVRLLHQILVTAFKGARRAKLLKVNPMEEVVAPGAGRKRKPKALDSEQVGVLLGSLAAAGHWLEPIAIVGFGGGMRRGELCGLQWNHVSTDGTQVMIDGQLVEYRDGTIERKHPKSEAGVRTVALPPQAAKVLRDLRRAAVERSLGLGAGGKLDGVPVFTRDGLEPIRPNYLTEKFSDFCDAHGLPDFTFHGTRHTHATALLKAVGREGAKAVSQRLGHADVMITLDVYQTVFESDDKELGDLAGGLFGGAKK